ncbi:MAG: tRNA threonylcarbamoyladenosine dehydratase [Bacteroidetes bacterium]|nr:MAG: tRNA threonylcarbamoyladenosine dehydratase [Bacteroidota bacterium]TAG88914.1 MAG: tRNA threonylcarbamoyladenosine dehydratase [Bacteroidota bacterium]
MTNWLSRTQLLVGEIGIKNLQNKHVLVVGMGGVGSYAAEYICRAGINKLTIVDGDLIEETNRNRQLPALISTEGLPKVSVMAQRLKDINADIELIVYQNYLEETKIIEILEANQYDYVVDAIDTITPKISLIKNCLQRKIKLISAMGAGGKLDPTQIKIDDIWKTYHCTLAQQVRKTLRRWKIKGKFKAVFSTEIPDKAHLGFTSEDVRHKKSFLGTISYMPSLFGAFCASVVVRDLIKKDSL